MIVGEAPGKNEDEGGKPFIGRSGELLDKFLATANLHRDEVYITNAVLCRPPNNKTPTKSQIKKCNEYLLARIKLVRPKIIITLGAVALQAVAGLTGIRKLRGKPIQYNDMFILPTYHPAFVLRDAKFEPIVHADFKVVRQLLDYGGLPEEKNANIILVNSKTPFNAMMRDIRRNQYLSFDIETTGLYPWAEDAEVVSIGFGTKHAQWVIPLFHTDTAWHDPQLIVEKLDDIIEGKRLIMHNGKFDSLWMLVHFGVLWRIHFDTMLAQYAIDENSLRSLKILAQRYFDAPDWDIDLDEKQGATTLSKLKKYHGHDLYYTYQLWLYLREKLRMRPSIQKLFFQLLMPVANMFVEAEERGVAVDMKKFDEVEEQLRTEINTTKKKLDKLAPGINWRSPQQVRELLFEDLGIKPLDRTASGQPSTSESVLKRIDHPITNTLMKYRGLDQQLKMFIDGWKPYFVDGRLHPSFKIDGTVTGRPSCENPNLQQVPRDPKIRSLIIATKNWVLVDSDLSQAEMRIAAELSNDPVLLQLFFENQDVHWTTAINEIARGGGMAKLVKETACDHLKLKNVTYSKGIEALLEMGPDTAIELRNEWKELRKKAKAVNFGYLYGMWWRKFLIYARDNYGIKLTEREAQESRQSFFHTYPKLNDWHERQRAFAAENGYVPMLSGRRRRLPRAMDKEDSYERAEALRQAINAPVQGFASDLNLMAAVCLHRKYGRDVYNPIGTVHDSVLQEVHKDHIDVIVPDIIRTMQKPPTLKKLGVDLRVPIVAEAELGPWGAAEKWRGEVYA